jgi:hypothetical protein
MVALLPAAVLLLIPRPPFDVAGNATYLAYRQTWGGNPNEVFSHFLDLVLMTGNATALGTLVVLEAAARNAGWDRPEPPKLLTAITVLGLVTSGLLALWLDDSSGEGTVIVVFPLYFLPVLLASRRLLRRFARRSAWRIPIVAAIAAAHALVHAALQYVYEPSTTGAPNDLFLPLWLASIGFWWWDVRANRAPVKRPVPP